MGENESVVNYVLKKRHCKLVSTGLDFGVEGFTKYREMRYHPTMSLCKRYYPALTTWTGSSLLRSRSCRTKYPARRRRRRKRKLRTKRMWRMWKSARKKSQVRKILVMIRAMKFT